MPTPDQQTHSQTITLVTARHAEEAQVLWWRSIADAWPDFLPPPTLNVVHIDDAVEPTRNFTGSAALLIIRDEDELAPVFKLVDRLDEQSIPCVMLFESFTARCRSITHDGVVAMPLSVEPSVIAASLGSLAMRQESFDQLRSELRVSRRFQGGICGEMDKIHDELALAASVQREFLPRHLPQVPNVDFRVLFRPAGYVSGDIYDVQVLDEHHVGFFVADAVGHGVPAALMTMVISRSLSTMETRGNTSERLSPGEVLRRLNAEMIERHGDTPRFATAVYGIIDCRTREVTLSSAGHPPPLLISPRGTKRVETGGGLLGIFPEDSFAEESFVLGGDEALVVYSDGFETAFPARDATDRERKLPTRHYLSHFEHLARTWCESGITSAIRGLSAELDRQTGSLHQVDDLTVMAVVPSTDRELDRMFTGSASEGERREHAPIRLNRADTDAARF